MANEKKINIKFSVLMSVYKREKPEYLKKALESIYTNQTLKPDEIILVEDGELTEELNAVIINFKNFLGDKFKIIPLEKNVGLGNALRIGLEQCQYEYVARMDTDDIAVPDRFEKQVDFLNKNPEIDIVGSYMIEFIDDVSNTICLKDCPTENFKKYIKFRDPMNHPTVFFKKTKVVEAGNYIEISLNEDTYLWARMLAIGCKFANIPEPLVYFRTTDDTYKRRGGLKYVKSEVKIQRELLKLELITPFIFLFNVSTKTLVRILPNRFRKLIYLKILRKKK